MQTVTRRADVTFSDESDCKDDLLRWKLLLVHLAAVATMPALSTGIAATETKP
jgi:hypothetical protein